MPAPLPLARTEWQIVFLQSEQQRHYGTASLRRDRGASLVGCRRAL